MTTAAATQRRRLIIFRIAALFFGVAIAVAMAEIVFRVLERRELARFAYEGSGGLWIPDARWGWKPAPGWFRVRNPEFTAEGIVNEHFMNDLPLDPAADAPLTRVFAVGDSHTFATGVSQPDTWPKQLERILNRDGRRFRVYNAGTTGYNMHQYVLRVTDQAPLVKPGVVIVAVTFASDFFDLLPPDRGGWIHGERLERDYFDFDEGGTLVQRHWVPPQSAAAGAGAPSSAPDAQPLLSRRIQRLILRFATFRYFRRTPLALAVASKLRLGNESLWPNMDIAMEREVSPEHEYNHRLFRALLARLKSQSDQLGARLVIVGVPYLPQVYEGLVGWAFSGDRFDPRASSRRLQAYCGELGINYIDVLDPMRNAVVRSGGRWVHFPLDGHPTVEGHTIIAEEVAAGAAPWVR